MTLTLTRKLNDRLFVLITEAYQRKNFARFHSILIYLNILLTKRHSYVISQTAIKTQPRVTK